MKVREVVRMLHDNGWYQVRMMGSHRHFKHKFKPRLVTVPGNPGKELAIGTLASIFKQAGLKK
jgi:predicted RNA binding protein YcfA (HicA-like mRNA interferase family)